jgi:hypothetical protein
MLHKEIQETQDPQGNPGSSGKLSEAQGIQRNPSGRGAFGKTKNTPPQTLAQFLEQAVHQATAKTREAERSGKWHSPCFEFTRQLKAHPELGPITAAKAIAKIEHIIRSWEDMTGDDFWGHFFCVSRDDGHAEILDCWDQVRRLPGLDALANAAEFSRRIPLSLSKKAFEKRGRSMAYCRFLSLCGWLQVTVGTGNPIAVPCREVADLIGVEPMTVSRFRKWALEDGFLQEYRKHQFHGPAAANKATEFFFAWNWWPILKQYAEGKVDE